MYSVKRVIKHEQFQLNYRVASSRRTKVEDQITAMCVGCYNRSLEWSKTKEVAAHTCSAIYKHTQLEQLTYTTSLKLIAWSYKERVHTHATDYMELHKTCTTSFTPSLKAICSNHGSLFLSTSCLTRNLLPLLYKNHAYILDIYRHSVHWYW